MDVIIIGCGNIAGGYEADHTSEFPLTHAGAFRKAGGFSLAACIDPDESKRCAFQHRWDVTHAYDSIESAFQDCQRYDVAVVCSPTEFHEEHLLQLLKCPVKLVICEKPISTDIAAARRIVAKYSAQGIPLAVNYTRRWDPMIHDLHDELAANDWGKIRSAVGFYNKGIFNNASHVLNLLIHFLGNLKIDWVGHPVIDHTPQDPTVDAVLSTSEGIPVHLLPGNSADYSLIEIRLVCENGIIDIAQLGKVFYKRTAKDSKMYPGFRELRSPVICRGGYVKAMEQLALNVRQHLTDGQPLACTGEDALATLELCHQIRKGALL